MEMDLTGILITAIVFFSIVAFVKILVDAKIRHKLIDKGMVDENVKYLYPEKSELNVSASLKWGMVLVGIGLGFIIGQLVPSRISDEVTVGSMFTLAGLGLILYYLIAKRMINKSK